MKKTHLATISAGLVAIPIIGLQFLQNSKLKTEVAQLEKTISGYREAETPNAGLSAIPPEQVDGKRRATNATTEFGTFSPPAGINFNSDHIGATLNQILAERDPLQCMSILLAYVGQLDESALPDALAQLRQNTPDWDPDARAAARLMLTRWGNADPDSALTYASGLSRDRAGDASIILSTIAAVDPQRAVKWLEDPDNKLANQPWIGRILAGSLTKEWVRQDPEAALEWAMNAPEKQRAGAYSGVLGTIAATDPKRASELAAGLPEGEARNDIIGQIARAWSESSPAEAIEWASTLAEGKERDRATNEALGKWAQSDPSQAAAFVDQLDSSERAEGMLDRIASNWARQEPENAAHWLANKDESKDKADAMGDVMWNWTIADPGAASQWLLDQPEGNSRDEGISSLAKATFEDDPASAVTWAANMTDENKRQWSVGVGVNVWLDRDPDAANEWLNSTDRLDPEWKEKILTEREERKEREAGNN